MSRLIDDIRRVGVAMPWFVEPSKREKWQRHANRLLHILRTDRDIPVIVADNVSTYYYEATGQENWDLTQHFPNVAPPFHAFWIEHRFPKVIHSDEKGDTNVKDVLPNGRAGVLIFGATRDNVSATGLPDGTHWLLASEIFLDYGLHRDRIDGSPGTIALAVDKDGRALDAPWMQSYTHPSANDIMRHFMGWLHPSLLTISFMHCRNVAMVDNHTPPKLAKKYREKHGFDPSSYKTLIIEPLKQILRREGKSDTVGVAKAMHICRGHFKDYRQGKGLFGKYHQLVWHDSLVRGTKGTKPPAREIEVKV